jgi:hypothetical protein
MVSKTDWAECPIGSRVEAKIDDLIKRQDRVLELLKDQNGRVHENKTKIAILYAGVAILAVVVPVIAPLLWHILHEAIK